MSAHQPDYPEHVLRDMRALTERARLMAETWPHAPGDHAANDAAVFMAEACDSLSDALAERDDYSDADRRSDARATMQDARRGAAA